MKLREVQLPPLSDTHLLVLWGAGPAPHLPQVCGCYWQAEIYVRHGAGSWVQAPAPRHAGLRTHTVRGPTGVTLYSNGETHE